MHELSHYQLCQLSELAYEHDNDKIKSQLSLWFPQEVKHLTPFHLKKTDTEGFITVIGDELCMVGTGTDTLKEWYLDILAIRGRFKLNGGTVGLHEGFQKVYYDLESEFDDLIINSGVFNLLWNNTIKSITYTGHSLGAFVAQALAVLHRRHFPCPNILSERIVTFGTPGGWSKRGAEVMDEMFPNFIRYENRWDVVTKIPATSTWAGKAVKLKGKRGHKIHKYTENMRGR